MLLYYYNVDSEIGVKLKKGKDIWYFSSGLLTEHTHALYYPWENRLVIVNLRYLSPVIKLLRKHIDLNQVTLELPRPRTK